jgi:hypothetical protein
MESFRSTMELIGGGSLTAIHCNDLSGTIPGLGWQAGDSREEVQREPFTADRSNHTMSLFVSRNQAVLT